MPPVKRSVAPVAAVKLPFSTAPAFADCSSSVPVAAFAVPSLSTSMPIVDVPVPPVFASVPVLCSVAVPRSRAHRVVAGRAERALVVDERALAAEDRAVLPRDRALVSQRAAAVQQTDEAPAAMSSIRST